MKCPKCGFDNPKGSKFCNQCGSLLSILSNKEDHLNIAQSYIPKELREKISHTSIEGERKKVTVLFADISGFTALSEKLDPEEVTELINKCFKSLIKVIYKYEGTIDKFIGDCIMALFGAPIAYEDTPERAVYSALEIMGALDRFNEEQGTKLSIHIGINSGIVVAGGVGSDLRMDYTVMGDTVNLAERLMSHAKDEILVSKPVYKKAGYLFCMQELEMLKVKGKLKKVKPYRVIGIKTVPESKRGICEVYSPLVGRDAEFKVIKDALEKVIKGKGAVVSLIGEAGLGKSRLIEELRKKTIKNTKWLSGRALSYGKTFPYAIILEQIRNYLGIDEFTPELEMAKRLKNKTKKLFGKRTAEYLPYLSLFLSLEAPKELQKKVKHLKPESLQLQEFVSVKALFKEIAKNQSLVLYFEDTHWIDQESIELIRFLLDGLKDVSVLFLFETRPEQDTGLYRILDNIKKIFKKRYREIRLKPLEKEDAITLVQNLLRIPGFPQDVSSLILKKSEGNPFYIEEIIRSFLDAGILTKKNKIYNFAKDISSFEIPDTVEAVIRSRIDRLPTEEKEVLGNASIIGRSFHYQVLSYITHLEKIDKAIAILQNGEFILKKSASSLSPLYSEYMFKHTLIREVAYNGLLKKKRKKIHKQIAECIGKKFKNKIENYFETLGHHYYYAEMLKKSYDYYKKAGDRAKELYKNNAAMECYTKSIEIGRKIFPDEKERMASLLERRGDVEVIKALYDNAFTDYKNSFKYYKELKKKADIKRKMGRVYYNKGAYDLAISSYESAIKMLKNRPSNVLSETLLDYAHLLFEGRSDNLRAEEMTERALAKIDKKKEPRIYAKGLNILGGISFTKGNYDKALKYYQKTLCIFEKLNDKSGISSSSNNIGSVFFQKGEFDKALKYYKKHLAISEEIGYKKGISIASGNIGFIYSNKGELDTALKYFERNLARAEEIGNKSGVGDASANIGIIYHDKGELDTALKYFKKHLSTSREIGDKRRIGIASGNIGKVYYDKGKIELALKYYKKYLSISEEIGYKRGIGIASCYIGNVYSDKNKPNTALQYYEKYLSISEKMGYKRGICIASGNIGSVYREKGKLDSALQYYRKELAISEEIGYKKEICVASANLGGVYHDKGELAKALEYYKKYLESAKEIGNKKIIGNACLEIGRLYRKMKKIKNARKYLEESVLLARKEKMKTALAESLYELSGLLYDSGEKKEAKKYLLESREISRKLGAKQGL